MLELKLLAPVKRAIHMGRIVPEIDPDLSKMIAEDALNPKKLATKRNYGMVFLPAELQTIAETKLQKYGDRRFRHEAKYLINTMRNIKLPDDKQTIKLKKADIATKLEMRRKISTSEDDETGLNLVPEDAVIARSDLTQLITGILEEERRDWHYYEYDERAANLYMAARLPVNYSCLKTVMKEIKNYDPNYQPRTVLDFGSGMGTTIWAINEVWPGSVSEFMNIEISKEQQFLCEYLLRGGKELNTNSLPGVFHRQYLPASTKAKYDIVVAAFSMLELPNRIARTQTIESLWQKTNDFLVIIERGNRGGFSIINEARHFVLDLSGHDVTKRLNLTTECRPITKGIMPEAHIIAPCPHEFSCPRAAMTTKKNMDVCRFKVNYEPLEIGERKPGLLSEEFSYVVFMKRPHPSYLSDTAIPRWPRIVESRKKAGGSITFKLCCPNGNLAEALITKAKHGKPSFELAKACRWGDILPMKIHDTYVSKNVRLRLKDK